MNLKSMKKNLFASVLTGMCMLTGCAGKAGADIRNGVLPSAVSASDTGTVKDSAAVETSGNVDMTVYEQYGLVFDKQKDCYTYNGSIVRYFNDWRGGACFTNYSAGTVDIEAEYDDNNHLIGIMECSQEMYDFHTDKIRDVLSMPADAVQETGTVKGSKELFKE